ncbi:MAG: glycogen/starch/alpha-glucan phosphorylase [Ruminococcus sp.]|jgi:starch phosphorylase|nr:glycogen/starch/alpha-glucan phosphorylase [Ruminococcus sp.]
MEKLTLKQKITENLKCNYCTDIKNASVHQLHDAVAKTVMGEIADQWQHDTQSRDEHRQACYLSAEFLMGRAIYNNLYCSGLLSEVTDILNEAGINIAEFEEIEDAALGNGGLGRLAACFLDSAATLKVPLTGYGIRYRYGLFKQYIHNGFQGEKADAWIGQGDAWSVRKDADSVTVSFGDSAVLAVPYDTPIIGYKAASIGTLRLWQAESAEGFNFTEFDKQEYEKASEDIIESEAISNVLYPNDNYQKGLRLRLKQQYFFVSASIQDLFRKYKKRYGSDMSHFAESFAIQLNDTHPTVAIPEIIRILMFNEGLTFEAAFEIASKTCSYTNHTVLSEALEKWDEKLFKSVIPVIYEIVKLINRKLITFLKSIGQNDKQINEKLIIDGGRIHMARMAIFGGRFVNGVAALHTQILKDEALKEWCEIFPERFQNKTNGITPRRWLGLCNPELGSLITEKIGDGWQADLDRLTDLKKFVDDKSTIARFIEIKNTKKKQLSDYILKTEGVFIDPGFVFDVQVKRLHEYKRQLLNAFSIMDFYFQIKEKKLPDLTPTAFIFGAKAAPAYDRAKGIIKYINCVADLMNNDPDTKDKLKVIFLTNYNVSYAEKIIPAADISEQISTAGLEASGTGNMKLMANGAVTLGTWDGANVEITEKAGWENEYIFGARVEEIAKIRPTYKPKEKIYYTNERVKRVVNTLVDGTFNDGDTGLFGNLFNSLINGASWHKPDNYFLLTDLEGYADTKLRALYDYKNREIFAKKCWMNICNCGFFSSDRTIRQYAEELWKL